MRTTIMTSALILLPLLATAQKKGTQPATLAVTATTVTAGTVQITWAAVSKVHRYEVVRCDDRGCAVKTTLSAFAPREYRETLTGSGTFVYRVTAYSSRDLPLATGQASYEYVPTAPLTFVPVAPPSATATPINLCAVPPTQVNVGLIGVTIQTSAPAGADLIFETWQESNVVGHAVERAPAGTALQGTGWTTLATTCDAASRFSPTTSAYGNPAFWFRDNSGGLTPSASYQYRARAVSSIGYYTVNVSPPWQAPAPIPPTLLPPAPPDAGDVGEVLMWIRWDQNLIWNGIRIREPDSYLITTSWGVRSTLNTRRCTCTWGIRTGGGEVEMPPGPQTVTIAAQWGSVTASSSQTVSR